MYITIEEMKSVLYEYQLNQIAESDNSILEEGILAATQEVKSYLLASNQRRETAAINKQQRRAWKLYDVAAIFAKTGSNRNEFLTRLVKRIAAWNICELCAPDIIYDRVKERYDAAIVTLNKIAGMGEYTDSRLILDELDTISEEDTDLNKSAFIFVSRTKFNHE